MRQEVSAQDGPRSLKCQSVEPSKMSKMALHMADIVLGSSVFVLSLLVFPVFCFSNTISFNRDELLNIRQNTPQNLLSDFDYSDVFLMLTVSKAADRSSRMRIEDLESAFAIRKASVTESSAVSVLNVHV